MTKIPIQVSDRMESHEEKRESWEEKSVWEGSAGTEFEALARCIGTLLRNLSMTGKLEWGPRVSAEHGESKSWKWRGMSRENVESNQE